LRSLREVLEEARRLVEPGPEEREQVLSVSERVLERCRQRLLRLGEVVEVSLEGSVAKDTWLKGRPDVDIFIHFRPDVADKRLEEIVVSEGREVVEGLGGRSWLRYASHPYVEGVVEGVRVNIVGCYSVAPGGWKSAADRTPYHTRYIKSVLNSELRTDVRLLKGFLNAVGIYGAEIRVEGFSGYLAELLVVWHGGFARLLEAAARWRPPVAIDTTGRNTREAMLSAFPNSGLIVIDPVDPARNVAAAVSLSSLSEFILASKLFLRNPSTSYFAPTPSLKAEVDTRRLLGLFIPLKTSIPPDILWGEVKRTTRGVAKRLEAEGFRVYKASATQAGEKVLILLELDRLELPPYELRQGPPVWMDNAVDFVEKTLRRSSRVAGPWVEGERLYALLRRQAWRASELLRRWVSTGQVSVSRHLIQSRESFEVLTSEDGLLERLESSPELRAFAHHFLGGLSGAIRPGEPDEQPHIGP
jgi:tRNA nucleotidyltransferase (CCA-adding enzyme)